MGKQEFWDSIELPKKADVEYVCIGVKASNYFMPKETLSVKGEGPGGGGWIYMNKFLQVTKKDGSVWGDGTVFAVGDCNLGYLGDLKDPEMPPVPKISYPGEEQALHAVKNVEILHKGGGKKLKPTWWPWGAGML